MQEELFLFVNPKSGGNKGEDFLKVPQPFVVNIAGAKVSLHIYSLLDGEPGDKEGFKNLKKATDASRKPIKIIVGGGDGTVMWADTEANKHGIHTPSKLVYGIVPLGTGNDFSRVAGWGGKNPSRILDNHCQVVKDYVRQWWSATSRPHDVWQVVIKVSEDTGQILHVDKNRAEAEIQGCTHEMTSSMINYFSIGQESKVGIEFDKHRTKSQTCNLFVYAYEGLCTEAQCCSQQHIGHLVKGLHHGADADAPLLFSSSWDDSDDTDEEDIPQLVGNPESLMFLNVNSYAGGNAAFWATACDPAVEPEPDDEDIPDTQDPGDGKLEVVTLPSIMDIPLDRVEHMAKRVISGAPFYIEFVEADEDEGEEVHVYCEVDGEFYHLVNPDCVTITLKKTLSVLQNGPLK